MRSNAGDIYSDYDPFAWFYISHKPALKKGQ